ncbi:MAG: exodeoxyribonuclease VII large subunit [Terrimicrobiaceae bacterium]
MQLAFDLTGKPLPIPKKAPALTEEPPVLSVSAVTRKIRGLLEDSIGEIWVEGEISNLRRQSSGHVYFTLKDSSAQLSCVMFARTASSLREVSFEDGQHLEVQGGLSVYEPRGQYQLIVRSARNRGAGALHAKFEALKQKLEAEGLFDPARKKPLPKFPTRLGLVTSPTGAAIRDFLNVLHRRHPGIEVVINPVRVQGRGAAAEIARAVQEFAEPAKWDLPGVDVVVITRGGGSLEDLWEFNEEVLARAIAACAIPVVSAVGHEIDFTICDFVADFRAPTPSAAAEILSADAAEILTRLSRESSRMTRACLGAWEAANLQLTTLKRSPLFREPLRRLDECAQRLDRSHNDLTRIVTTDLANRKAHLAQRARVFHPAALLTRVENLRLQSSQALLRLAQPAHKSLALFSAKWGALAAKLSSLNPQATLERGFTITCDEQGVPIRSSKEVAEGIKLSTRFHDGRAVSVVQKVSEE